jgi:hypothetical protein
MFMVGWLVLQSSALDYDYDFSLCQITIILAFSISLVIQRSSQGLRYRDFSYLSLGSTDASF